MTDTYVALDLETTGLNPKKEKIIEVGAVKVCKGVITDTFSSLVNPGRSLGDQISQLTGIDNAMLLQAPQPEEILPKILDFTEGFVLVGHRILFDFSFIKKAAVNLNLVFERDGIDTLKIARKYLPYLESRGLESLCVHFGIEHQAHRASSDARAASDLYLKMADLFYEENDFKPTRLIWQVKKEVPVTKPQRERLYKLLDRHKIIIDYEIDKLTKNEASRIIDHILAGYGR